MHNYIPHILNKAADDENIAAFAAFLHVWVAAEKEVVKLNTDTPVTVRKSTAHSHLKVLLWFGSPCAAFKQTFDICFSTSLICSSRNLHSPLSPETDEATRRSRLIILGKESL